VLQINTPLTQFLEDTKLIQGNLINPNNTSNLFIIVHKVFVDASQTGPNEVLKNIQKQLKDIKK